VAKQTNDVTKSTNNKRSFFTKLRNTFGIVLKKKDKFSTAKIPVPAIINPDLKIAKPVKLPSDLEKMWKWWLSETADSSLTLKNRMDRYSDLDYMYYNNTVISMAVDLYADETVQLDSQSEVLQVTAKKAAVRNYIQDFFTKIGITPKILKAVAFDLALYGDHFWVTTSNLTKGITEIVPIDVKSLTNRLEFNAIEVSKLMRKNKKIYTQLISRQKQLQKLADVLKNGSNDTSSYFRKYLFGFQIEKGIFLPPWNVVHFRRFSTHSEFYPFGRPLLINCISPFRQLQTSKTIVAMARVAKFPKELFEVEVNENMTEVEKWNAVNEARQEWLNLGTEQTGKEDFGVGGKIWTPKGLIDYSLIENRMSVDDISDLEMLRDDMILGTRVPKGYLIVDRASFGTSGQALLQQFKPFGRAVFGIQTCILEELTQLVRLHFIMTNTFVDEPFELSMTFPVIEESSDRLRIKSDTIRLANDIITNIQSALGLGRGEALPPNVVKDIFSKLSFLNSEDINKWIDEIKPPEISENQKKYIQEKVKRINLTMIMEAYFLSKELQKFEEGIINNRHFYSSSKITNQQKIILDLIKTNNRLNE